MPTIDIVILNYNTKHLLELLLPKVIENSTMEGVKVVVADNASSDGSVDYLKLQFPNIELIELTENTGYAGGYNRALKNRISDYFILLNSDAEPGKDWLIPFINLINIIIIMMNPFVLVEGDVDVGRTNSRSYCKYGEFAFTRINS